MKSPDTPSRFFVVDAFTDRLFAGNPAAVVLLDSWDDESWLQNVAMEMNHAETAFLVANESGFDLRWFTPKVEVDLCGHATIASSVVLADVGLMTDGSSVAFSTRSGILTASREGSQFKLDFPALRAEPCESPGGLLESLNIAARPVKRSKYDFVVEVETEAMVRELEPDFQRLATVECRGVVVTAPSNDGQFDFVSRFFAPAVGVNEDAVTGSAHCILAPLWAARLGKSRMTGYQASQRGGVVHVDLRRERVLLGGEGVIFARGELNNLR